MNQKNSSLLAEYASFFRNVNLFSAFVVLACCMSQATIAEAFPGDLDRTFGRNGKAQLQLGNLDSLRAAALQPDGKIIAVGFSFGAPGLKNLIIRLNSDGSPDTSFDGDGIALTEVNGNSVAATAVNLQSDGKIVVSGTTVNSTLAYSFAVVRFNSNGSIDSSFGTNGIVITNIGDSFNDAKAATLQRDGKIIVAGETTISTFNTNLVLVRYHPNGSLDTEFGNAGIVKTNIGNVSGANAIAVQIDGKIIAAGYGEGDFAIVRYNPNGTLDTTFDFDGIATTLFGNGLDERINAAALQPDGKIVALGTALNYNGTFTAALARYNTDGSLDSSFGEGGKLAFTYGVGSAAAFTLALQPDGKIIGGGHTSTPSSSHSTVFRLNGDGTFDRSFGDGGIAFNSFLNSLVGLLVQTDGKIIGVNSSEINRFVSGGVAYFDFDADRKDDVSVFRPSGGTWYFLKSAANTFQGIQFGVSTDRLAPADYDGDGKADIAVFRNGFWYLIKSRTNTFYGIQFGQTGDVPVPADYDGDGKADIAVYRYGLNAPYDSYYYILNTSNNSFRAEKFGSAGDYPVPADYDGDGQADLAVFTRLVGIPEAPPPPSFFSYRKSSSTDRNIITFHWGLSSDLFTPGDYDADGRADVAVFRPSNGTWYLLQSTAGFRAVQFGQRSDVPVPADYDGDRKTDIAVFRNGFWYQLLSETNSFHAIHFGQFGDIPIESVYVR
ncbi:MAG TPA: FG-GAP-like repeat-containing protein [Pyrinomonadaceae bacterium]|jgi:uncharacterized delta-60 repeat protein